MKLYDLEMLRSPCCRSPLRAGEGEGDRGLMCEACGAAYPVQGGIPSLVHIDHTSLGELVELLGHQALFRISSRTAGPGVCSPDQQQAYDFLTNSAWRAFDQVLPKFDFSSHPRVLDVGAGDCVTSALLAERGAVVVATDLRVNVLSDPGDVVTRRRMDSLPEAQQAEARARLQDDRYSFDRVQASADRLPFADGLFDYVFCRATLHHVPDLRKAIVEMGRVLRLGGTLVACAEPFRGGLESAFRRVKGLHDYLMGANEQCPRLRDYLRSLRAAGLGAPALLTMDLESALLWEHAPPLLPRALYQVVRPLVWREVPARARPLLHLCSGGVSLVAVKRHHRPGTHRAGPRLLAPELLDGNTAHTPRLAEVARYLRRDRPFLSRLRTSRAPQEGLRFGWYLPEVVDPGPVQARYSFPYCVATLRAPRGATSVTITCRGFAEETSAPTHGRVWINGLEAGAFCLTDRAWQTLRFRVPDTGPIVDVEIETEEVYVPNHHIHNGDTRTLGLAVLELAATR